MVHLLGTRTPPLPISAYGHEYLDLAVPEQGDGHWVSPFCTPESTATLLLALIIICTLITETVKNRIRSFKIQLVSLTHRVSATEYTVLVQNGTKTLVCAATSVTVLPCEKKAKASHDGVFPLIRELLKIAVVKTSIWNVEHSQHHLFWYLFRQITVDICG